MSVNPDSRPVELSSGLPAAVAGAPLEIQSISHTYVGPRALDNVTFAVAPAQIFGLLGPNGGGKTTLFRILSTLMRPSAGTATVFGADLLREPDRVRSLIGVVFQNSSIDAKLGVAENMRHQGRLYGMRGAPLEARIVALLTRVGLRDRAHHRVEILSGGQRRRVELAKGLLHSPRLLLLDEPSTGLDPVARRELWSYLRDLRDRDGVSVLVTTHLMEEAEYCDRLAIIHKGRLVAIGTPDELKRDVEGDVIAIESKDADRLASEIDCRWKKTSRVVGRSVRIETRDGAEWVPRIVREFPELVDSITLARPTLEDVFIRRTGERMMEADGR